MVKRRLFIALLSLVVLLAFNISAASAETVEWGPVQKGIFTPYLEEGTNSDVGFDFTTGTMTNDPAKRDFILFQGLWMVKVKGIETLHQELLSVPSEVPASIVDTEIQIALGNTYIIRSKDETYVKVIFTRELGDEVHFDYVLLKGLQGPSVTTPGVTAPGAGTPATGLTGVGPAMPGVGGPVTIINNNTTINQNTNTTTNNANTTTSISGSTIANSNIASNNQTSQTTTNDNSIKVTQYVNVLVNGQPLQSDVKPFVNADGRTMLPVRPIAEALGAQVQWDDPTQTATLSQGGKTVKVPVGQKTISVDGRPVTMDTAAVIKDGRTLLPVRPIGEALGAKIGWDDKTSTVKIDRMSWDWGN